MIRKTLLVLLWVGFVCGLAVGATKTIVLKDGSTYTGDVTENVGAYQIKLPTGEVISYPKDKATVTAAADPAVEYKTRLGRIDGKDADGHTDIGVWAQHGGYLDIAYKEYSEALRLSPGDARATLRLQQVKDMLDALAKAGNKVETSTSKPGPGVGPGPAGPGPGIESKQSNLISDEDVYKVRMFEVRKREVRENPPVFLYADKKVQSDFITMMVHEGKDEYKSVNALQLFKNRPMADQLRRIREHSGDQGLLDRIHITSDPEFMRAYRNVVAPQLRLSCAADGCHGAPAGKGELKLFTIKSDQADYTNFVILSLWEKNGQFLIDRRVPENSLLLQHGLPVKLATAGFAHPKVPQRQTLFNDAKTDNYRKILNWINGLEGALPPAYHTEYQPPVGRKLNSNGVSFVADEKPTSAPAPASKPTEEGSKDIQDK